MTHVENYRSPTIASLYGLAIYLAFDSSSAFGAMAVSFIFVVPVILGVLVVVLAPEKQKVSMQYGTFAPWLACFVVCGILMAFAIESIICIVMSAPIFLPLASFGGIATVKIFQRRRQRDLLNFDKPFVGVIALLPLAFMGVESLLPTSDAIETVERDTIIYADPATIWENMVAVPSIASDEADYSWFHMVGMPRPVEARLEGEGVGAVRIARYDNGLILREPIGVWQPEQELTFDVAITDAAPKPFNMVGGSSFDVLEVGFKLEPQSDGGVRVRLHTTYRLTTGINFYGKLWMNYLMGDLQEYILTIIKQRSEAIN